MSASQIKSKDGTAARRPSHHVINNSAPSLRSCGTNGLDRAASLMSRTNQV
jgi:hypothetical protein